MKMVKLGAIAIIALITGTNAFSKDHKTTAKFGTTYYVIQTDGSNYVVTTSLGTCDGFTGHACIGTSSDPVVNHRVPVSTFTMQQSRSNP